MSRPSRILRPQPLVPEVPQVARALERCEPLASLLQRLQMSERCLRAIRPVLPAALLRHVKAGPIDEEGWTLLVANPAISAKLRQLQPRLQEALIREGVKVSAIRLRVQTG